MAGKTDIEKQDWTRLQKILAPKLYVSPPCHFENHLVNPCYTKINYAKVNNAQHTDLPADDFITMMKNPLFLGDPNIDSQHMLGLSKWEKLSDTEITSYHQSRAAHMRWHDGRKAVAAKGHGHGLVTTFYRKIDDEWKWAGIETRVRWNEHEFEEVFIGTAGKFETE